MKKVFITFALTIMVTLVMAQETKTTANDSVTWSKDLEGVTVTRMRRLAKADADKITYDVKNDDDAKASTVLDMLRKVPMVSVDGEDNITVNGSSSFKVYVDGKPNMMMSSAPSQVFKSMPASMVKSIEVVTNPGAKYDAEGGAGVLNIVMNKEMMTMMGEHWVVVPLSVVSRANCHIVPMLTIANRHRVLRLRRWSVNRRV